MRVIFAKHERKCIKHNVIINTDTNAIIPIWQNDLLHISAQNIISLLINAIQLLIFNQHPCQVYVRVVSRSNWDNMTNYNWPSAINVLNKKSDFS